MNLFTYGTLMFPEIWRQVVGRQFATATAVLAGYAAYRVRNGVYPVMVSAEPESRTSGLIYFDVDVASLALLDEYESDLYARVPIVATADDGRPIECQAYVLPAPRQGFASDELWDAARFEQEVLRDYLKKLSDD